MAEKDFAGFRIAIIGLGLMGGSFAYALRGFRDCVITGYDTDGITMKKAIERKAVDKLASSVKEAVSEADISIFCTNPHSILKDIRENAPYFKKGSVVADICGVREKITALVSEISGKFNDGVDYIGIHPMAGKEVNGFDNADSVIFNKAGFILILPENYRKTSLDLVKELSLYAGAGRICVNSAAEHDRIIAYTSDLMHISATALCVNYPDNMTMAHTAGAFRDCTRIANIKADLWTDLLTENAESIIPQLDLYIKSLTDFKTALAENNQEYIYNFLNTACINKKEMQSR
jgi:prephenate dehydrogenase